MTSRKLFYVQAILASFCIIVGMSESYVWLAWAKRLIPFAPLLLPANMACLITCILAKQGAVSLRSNIAISGALVSASFYALSPLIM